MNSPVVLICCHDPEWMRRARSALDDRGYLIRERLGELSQIDLMADGDHPAPDIVLWRFDGRPAAYVHDQLHHHMRWALGTKFVFVRHRRWGFPVIYMVLRSPATIPYWLRYWRNRVTGTEPWLAPVLPPTSTMGQVVKAVDRAAATCWWRQLCDLDFPACQVSPSGRILRVNSAMVDRFGQGLAGTYFGASVEGSGPHHELLPDSHPIRRTVTTGRACEEFVESPRGQFQLICLPDQIDPATNRDEDATAEWSVSVLVPDVGSRSQVFDFAKKQGMRDLQEIYEYIVDCAVRLGYPRVRLYCLSEDKKEFYGVASRGFQDQQKKRNFETRFRITIAEDPPSSDTMYHRIPVVCTIGGDGDQDGGQRKLVRSYPHRRFVEELELGDAKRWIEAPLVVPGGSLDGGSMLGKLVVDRGRDSDQLGIRDAFDVGLLAMMAAGAIHAFNERQQESRLRTKQKFLSDLLEVLPLFAFQQDDKKFYRSIAAILSSHAGLCWEQVMLFIVDSSGLKRAVCEMAIGGSGEPEHDRLREQLSSSLSGLRDYLKDALERPDAPDDTLYQKWVEGTAPYRIVSFARPTQDDGPAAMLLSQPVQRAPYQKIDVQADPWCRRVNEAAEGTFASRDFYAFPLTNSFALDVEMFGAGSRRTQPVGVALVGATSRDGTERPDLELTRVTLDLLGTLIAQRWTSRRIWGVLGALSTIHHSELNDSWDRVRRAVRRLEEQVKDLCGDNPSSMMNYEEIHDEYDQAEAKLDEIVNRTQIEKAALKNTRPDPRDIDFGDFLDRKREAWTNEWSAPRYSRLVLEAPEPESPVAIPCDELILNDVMTCLIGNSVRVATERRHPAVRVKISSQDYVEAGREFAEITVEDDAGGVDKEMIPFLFLKNVSGRRDGGGQNLALVRAQLLMYSGDLRYLLPGESYQDAENDRGAKFQILFYKGAVDGQRGQPREMAAHRRQ